VCTKCRSAGVEVLSDVAERTMRRGGELDPGKREVEIICGASAWNASLEKGSVILADRGIPNPSSWWRKR